MTEIRLLVVPYEVGASRMGVGRGPERLLELGAERALASHGAPSLATRAALSGTLHALLHWVCAQ